jgi:hypothetical protein
LGLHAFDRIAHLADALLFLTPEEAALVPVARSAGTAALAAALGHALERPRSDSHAAPRAGDAELLRALGLA